MSKQSSKTSYYRKQKSMRHEVSHFTNPCHKEHSAENARCTLADRTRANLRRITYQQPDQNRHASVIRRTVEQSVGKTLPQLDFVVVQTYTEVSSQVQVGTGTT